MPNFQRTKRAALLVPLLLVGFGCASGPQTSRIDDALLAEVEEAALDNVIASRASRDKAEVAYAKAQQDTEWASQQVDLSRSSLKVARAELDETKLEVAMADKNGTVAQLASANSRHTYSIANADLARDRLALRKREYEFAKLAEKLALERLRLERSKVELEKAMAVQQLDRVASTRIPIKDYQKQVRYHDTEVQLAQVRVDAAAAELVEAEAELQEMMDKAEGLRAEVE